jgi:hypothetical protein
MSARGLLKMNLTCPAGHIAGFLIRQSEHHPIEIELPDTTRAEWPRRRDGLYTDLTCNSCNREIYGSTDAIKERATWLSESQSDSQGQHGLRYVGDSLA